MSSRLDRLFVLLDQGSSQVTRKAAALELGEVQRLHPHELNNLLSKVRTFLHSNLWDTRVAAGQAVEAIVNNVDQWQPKGLPDREDNISNLIPDAGQMTFDHFDVNLIIKNGRDLLASEGKEFDDKVSFDGETWKEKVLHQRKLLNSRLGLPEGDSNIFGINTEEMVSNEDLMIESKNSSEKRANSDSLKTVVTKKIKREISTRSVSEAECDSSDKVLDLNNLRDWPLEWFADELMNDLFNPVWEIRHGAATGLREIVKLHGRCAGRSASIPSKHMEAANQVWLVDLSLRFICVLALDKFGDFVSDQVVAPVRETCAQALGSVFHTMQPDNVSKCLSVLLQLLQRPEWEARHGGLLGLKYMLAVRQDLTRNLLPLVFEPIFCRLKDSVDDVSAVAAAALVPVKDVLIECLPDAISSTLTFLWDALLEIDDLTSSTSSILMLLSSLLSFVKQRDCHESSLFQLIPRLWPFLGHILTSVRKSVLEALITLTSISDSLLWMEESTLATFLGLLFQRSLVESNEEICSLVKKTWQEVLKRCSSEVLFRVTSPFISGWICLVMHPAKIPIDASSCPSWVSVKHKKNNEEDSYQEKMFLGGSESLSEGTASRERAVIRSRMMSSSLLGVLSARMTLCLEDTSSPSPLECLTNLLFFHLNSRSAVQRISSGFILIEWAKSSPDIKVSPPKEVLLKSIDCLQETFTNFDEFVSTFAKVQADMREFVMLLIQHKVLPEGHSLRNNVSGYTFDEINEVVSQEFGKLVSEVKLTAKNMTLLDEKCKLLSKNLSDAVKCQSGLSLTTSAVLASAVVSWSFFPDKLNPLIRPLMESIKKEDKECIQDISAKYLAQLLASCPAPAAKVVKNLVTFVCCDFNKTPVIKTENGSSAQPTSSQQTIMTLSKMQKMSERANLFKRSTSMNKKQTSLGDATPEVFLDDSRDVTSPETMITTRGASVALLEIVKYFGPNLKDKMPHVWLYYDEIIEQSNELDSQDKVQNVIECLQVLEVTAKHLDSSLRPHLVSLLNPLCSLLHSPSSEVRHMSCRCFGVLSSAIKKEVMSCLVDKVVKDMSSNNEIERMGAVEAVACVIEALGLEVVPYIVLLVCPMLSRTSDQNQQIRLLATQCFAQLVQLMPLDNKDQETAVSGDKKEELLSQEILERKREERKFLQQLLNPKKLENFSMPIEVNAELRSYQQDGVNWLAFLNKFNLHGILCDEMGLGKTLMSICILASDHFLKKNKEVKVGPSLVVCPPTLTGHWAFEVDKFVSKEYLSALHYTGSPTERTKLKDKLQKQAKRQSSDSSTLVVASYDIVRNDIEFFSSITWNYCILDEGHIIKNGKTKMSKAMKSLIASHRLILTGTPIQNNVLELWSLFDFLMPGFLGTERQFVARFSRPILASRDAKSSSKEQEAGVLAMESLHRQVLPFILRRMKEDVLKDLPPKIIQDYYCELSPLQSRLYEDFARSQVKKNLEQELIGSTASGQKENKSSVPTHVFQALQYLRKVCNHPKLVLTSSHPEFKTIQDQLTQQKTPLSDINHAAKLVALRQLLQDSGIGIQSSSVSGTQAVVNQHRALIFCQLKSMLDIVENDLLKTHLPSVSFLRLDGSIPPGSRHNVVHRFNNDPSIDVLLLTTQVGGLGLNLTGADTVIFVEHDWNPMKDLQAMDRAHRIGQKKVVNVYRLVTSGTLEEKIMGLQKFKLTIANTVISHENSSLQTMATDQLLDLFSLDNNKDSKSKDKQSKSETGVKSILENLPELWENDAYDSEYNLDSFVQSLKSN